MRLLLDTHVWLWWMGDPDRLGADTTAALASPNHLAVVSAASVWEVTIKRGLGKLRFDGDPVAAVGSGGFEPLPISLAHAAAAGDLPVHHRDPFDRMLVAQARVEGLTIVTGDPSFGPYDVPVLAA